MEYEKIAEFQKGNNTMSFTSVEYIIYDEKLKYINLDLTDKRLKHGKTLLVYYWGMGGASVKIADFIPNEIQDYIKYIYNQEIYDKFKQ